LLRRLAATDGATSDRSALLGDVAARSGSEAGAERFERLVATSLSTALLLEPEDTLRRLDSDATLAAAVDAVLSGDRVGSLAAHLRDMLDTARGTASTPEAAE